RLVDAPALLGAPGLAVAGEVDGVVLDGVRSVGAHRDDRVVALDLDDRAAVELVLHRARAAGRVRRIHVDRDGARVPAGAAHLARVGARRVRHRGVDGVGRVDVRRLAVAGDVHAVVAQRVRAIAHDADDDAGGAGAGALPAGVVDLPEDRRAARARAVGARQRHGDAGLPPAVVALDAHDGRLARRRRVGVHLEAQRARGLLVARVVERVVLDRVRAVAAHLEGRGVGHLHGAVDVVDDAVDAARGIRRREGDGGAG